MSRNRGSTRKACVSFFEIEDIQPDQMRSKVAKVAFLFDSVTELTPELTPEVRVRRERENNAI